MSLFGSSWASTPQQQAALRHREVGDAYQQKKRLPEARQEWQTALVLDPACPGVAERLANLLSVPSIPTPIAAPPGEAPKVVAGASSAVVVEANIAEQHYQASRLREAELSWQRVLAMDASNSLAHAGLEKLKQEIYQPQSDRPFDQMTEELYEEGMKAYRRGDWGRAGIKFAQATNLNPFQPQVKRYLSLTRQIAARIAEVLRLKTAAENAEKQKSWSEARTEWENLLRLDPTRSEAWQGVSRTAEILNQREDEHAVPDQKKPAVSQNREPSIATAMVQQKHAASRVVNSRWFNEGVTAYRQGALDTAIRAWEQACQADPQDQESQQWLVKARHEQEEKKAVTDEQADTRYAQGLAAYQRGDVDEAMAAWKAALALNPDLERARANLKRVQAEMH